VRIISGKIRGLKLNSPSGTDTRPTLDRVKEAIFSMLTPYLNDAVVLDLFAGSGALGLESLSRGACKAVLVDSSSDAISCIKSNISAARMENSTDIYKTDALRYLEQCSDCFDIIFLDPPYFAGIYDKVIGIISERNLLSENGLIVVEWDFENGFTNNILPFVVFREKKYGRVGVTVLKRGLTE